MTTGPTPPAAPPPTDASAADGADAYRAAYHRLLAHVAGGGRRGAEPTGVPCPLRKAFPVELQWSATQIRTMTLELGADRFSVLIGAPPPPGQTAVAILQLGRRDTVRATVRTATVLETQGSWRVTFLVADPPQRGASDAPGGGGARSTQPVARIRTTTMPPPVLVRQRPTDQRSDRKTAPAAALVTSAA